MGTAMRTSFRARERPGATAVAPWGATPIWILALICGLFGTAAWVFWALYICAFRGNLGQDWMVFYIGARAYIEGNLAIIFDGQTLTEVLNQRFSTWLSAPLNLHPWVYPPRFFLL